MPCWARASSRTAHGVSAPCAMRSNAGTSLIPTSACSPRSPRWPCCWAWRRSCWSWWSRRDGQSSALPDEATGVSALAAMPRRRRGRVRGVGELAELAAHDERDLLADVDRVVADSLDVAGDQHHVAAPFAGVLVGADLDRLPEHLTVQPVDHV